MNKIDKIVILGGSGFIGAQLATKLSSMAEKIIIPTRDIESNQGLKMIPNLEIMHLDVKDDRSVNLLFDKSDLVINTIGILNEFDQDNSFDNIRVLNVLGEVVFEINEISKNKNVKILDFSNYTKGVYLVKIKTSNGVINRKLVIE